MGVIKAEEALLGDDMSEIRKKRYDASVGYMRTLDKLASKDSREMVLSIISGIKAKAEQIKFALVDQFEDDQVKEMALQSEADPVGTLDIYVRSIFRGLLDLQTIVHIRARDIKEMRKEFRESKRAK